MNSVEIHVDRQDIRRTALVTLPLSDLADGDALVQIEGFALTTNNVTYAATGDIIGYWQFFPTGVEAKGIVPAWGFARVVASRSPTLDIGTRLYGFFPMASHMRLTPERRGEIAVRDSAPHRKELPAVYNTYMQVEDGPETKDAQRAIFQPLLVTSYLLYDFLEDNNWFGAEQIIIGSASSKTGLGLCKYLAEARPNGPRVIGLTSDSNRAFVTGLNACDQVVGYDEITADIADVPSVYVDMAGNAAVRRALHVHLGDHMVHSAAVGTSHWDKFEPTPDLPGAKPRFFFAPSQIEKRRSDWGPGQIEKRLETAWRRIADNSADWIEITVSEGLDQAADIYRELAAGNVSPNTGHYIRL